MSSKHLDDLDWAEAVRMLVSKQHLTAKGQTVIRLLKQNMNQHRSTFYFSLGSFRWLALIGFEAVRKDRCAKRKELPWNLLLNSIMTPLYAWKPSKNAAIAADNGSIDHLSA